MDELASPSDGRSSAKPGEASRQASVSRVGRNKFMHKALFDKGSTVAARWSGDQIKPVKTPRIKKCFRVNSDVYLIEPLSRRYSALVSGFFIADGFALQGILGVLN